MTDLPDATKITGERGELVQRLCMALDTPALDFSEFMTASVYLTHSLGFRSMPFSDEEEQRPGYLRQLSDRLMYLIDLGVDEAFLVGALRDVLTKQVDDFADVQKTAEKRAAITEPLRKALADPAELAAYRRLVEDSHPETRDLTDTEVRKQLESIVNLPHLGPPDAEASTAAWAHHDHWEQARNTYLSDDGIDKWLGLHLHRLQH
jgi:hypothetical protein